jgi:6-phosphogluconolactonase
MIPSLRGLLFAAFLAWPVGCSDGSPWINLPPSNQEPGDGAAPPVADGSIDPATGDAAAPAPGVDADVTSPDGGTATEDAGAATDAGSDATALGPLVVYASGYEPNIDRFPLDPSTGALSAPASTTSFGTSPSFLVVNRAATHLYAVDENTAGQVGAYTIDPASGALTFQNAVSSGGNGPPFVALDRSEAYVLVANYGDGTVSVLPVKSDGSLSAPSSTVQVGTNAHMILPDPSNRFVFVPCLGSDYVAQFLFDASTGTLTPNAVPHVATASGAGPRHIAFHPNGKYVYLVNETNSTLSCYSLDASAGTLTPLQTVSTLPPGFSGTNTAAEVWVHPSGAWVLMSNRGADDIAVFPVDATSGHIGTPTFTPSGGTTPRDFTIDPTGTFVLAANEGTGNLAPFKFDAATGALTAAGTPVSLTNASFVGVVRLAAGP